jgi:glucose/arabinose dehydrogenase/outer membrane protein assembly factor BamB
MRKPRLAVAVVRAVVLSGVVSAFALPARAVVPLDFQDSLIASLTQPTALAFTPDGRLLITRQPGVLRIVQGGALLATPALTLTPVCSGSERGLLGVAVDPAFTSNNFIYLYYTANKAGTCVNRVSRFTLPATNVVSTATEVILLDNMHSIAGNHNAGDLNFGKDGYLYVSVGDGGCDYANDSGCGGQNDASRDVNTLNGKILRITRDGAVPPDNPFVGAGTASCKTGDAAAGVRCQETFAWGLRNPFRFAMDPGALGTRFFINDVGQSAWEEIDLGQKGADYGWNCREGAHANPEAGATCSPAPPAMVDPIFEYPHAAGCGSITGGDFLPSGSWPATFDGSYFYSDYNCGTIYKLVPNGAGGYTSTSFATGLGTSSAVHLEFGPAGTGQVGLYYTNYAGGGQVRVITFVGTGNRSPHAVIGASPLSGSSPLLVTFDGTGSSDPDGDTLTYLWSFGDGTPDGQTSTVTTTHTYAANGTYTAVLRTRDPANALSDPVSILINVDNTPPVPTIVAPAATDLFRVGQTVTLVGSALDAEDGALADSRLTWNILKHHDAHTHPFLTDVVGNNIVITTPPPEDVAGALTSYLEIQLTATDSKGAQTTITQDFNPHKVDVTLQTTPSGLGLQVNGGPVTAPVTITSWESWDLQLNAPDQTSGGTSWTFVAWSDGGAQTHTFTTPAAAVTLGASFGTESPAPDAAPFLALRSTNQANRIDWLNPSGPQFVSATLVFRADRFPTTPADGALLFTGGAPGTVSVVEHGGLTNGTTYYYAAFVNLAGGGISSGRFAKGTPFDTAGPVKWAYTTGATAVAPPAIGVSVLAVSNDRGVHAMEPGTGGGSWPAGYAPLLLGGAVQSRPPVVTTGLVPAHPTLAFVTAQDGKVYGIDAATGALVWESPVLGQSLQAGVAGGFTAFGFFTNRLFVGTRNASAANVFYALDPANGQVVGTPYAGAEGGGLGIVSGGAAVDYATNRVYFASRAAESGAHTLWCVEATAGGFVYRWSADVGDVDGSPVVRRDRVYVGGNDGVVHAFDKVTGVEAWAFATGGGAIKAFLFPDRANALYFAGTSAVFGLADDGEAASPLFPPIAANSPSPVLFRPATATAPARLYFGGGDQKLHEVDLSQSPPVEKTIVLGTVPAVIGAPTFDTARGLVYVGSDAGVVYAIETPLP